MPRHVDAWMDGVALSGVGPVIIQQVHEDAPTLDVISGERPGRYGQLLTGRKRQALKVTIEAAIRELRRLEVRAEIAERVAAWAQGSVLELSNHPGRVLMVQCTGEPTLGDVRDYTETMRLEFTASEVPYWQDRQPRSVKLNGKSGAGSLYVPGTVETPVSVTVEPTGGTLSSLTIRVGRREIALTGLSVKSGGKLALDRDARDTLAIRSGTVSLLASRAAESDDDLMTPPGSVAISYSANVACNVSFSVCGRWA